MNPKDAETRRKVKVLTAYIQKQLASGTAPQDLYRDLITRKVPHKLAVKMIDQGLAQIDDDASRSTSEGEAEAARLEEIRTLINSQADAGRTVNQIRDQLVEKEISPDEAAALILRETGLEVSPLDSGPQVSPFLSDELADSPMPPLENRKAITTYVGARLSAGMELKLLVDSLIEHGMERNQAINLVMDIKQRQDVELRDIGASPTDKSKADMRKTGLRNLLIGGGLFLIGSCITLVTYLSAEDGGTYWLFYGPIIFGLVYGVMGLVQWLRNR